MKINYSSPPFSGNASDVSIADAGGYYSGTDVEAALQEVGAGTTLDGRYVNIVGDTMTGQLDFSGTGHAGVKLNNLTTAQKNALTPAQGQIVMDTDADALFIYDGSRWRPPFSANRTVIVDITGKGDFTDISDACSYVAAQSPGVFTAWLILIMPGDYNEASGFSIPSHTTLKGLSNSITSGNSSVATNIRLTHTTGNGITMGVNSAIVDMQIFCYGVTVTGNGSLISGTAGAFHLDRVNIQDSRTKNANLTLKLVEATGSASALVQNCFLYMFAISTGTGNNIYIDGRWACRFSTLFSQAWTGSKTVTAVRGSVSTSRVYNTRFGGDLGEFTYDIDAQTATVEVNNTPYKNSIGSNVRHADRWFPTEAALREAPAATDTPTINKGAAGQSAAISQDTDSSDNVHNQWVIHSGGENVINEQGIDIDTRIEGNNVTNLFKVDAGNDQVETHGGIIRNITTVNAATYDLLTTDDILHVTYTSTGAVTSLTLPTAQTVAGRVIEIKDAGGNAATNNITVDTEGSELIDGQATFVLNNDYQSLTLYCNGSNWYVI